jgi:hypothetical protein
MPSANETLCRTNNHPFTFGIHTIMHNGYISDFGKIKLKLCQAMSQEAYEHIAGGTDTEHFAALLMSYLCSRSKDSTLSNPYSGEEGEGSLPRGKQNIPDIKASLLGSFNSSSLSSGARFFPSWFGQEPLHSARIYSLNLLTILTSTRVGVIPLFGRNAFCPEANHCDNNLHSGLCSGG